MLVLSYKTSISLGNHFYSTGTKIEVHPKLRAKPNLQQVFCLQYLSKYGHETVLAYINSGNKLITIQPSFTQQLVGVKI